MISKLTRVRPPIRRVLALDAGSRLIKLLLAESHFGKLRLLNQELIDLQAEGLVSPEEIQAHLQVLLDQWGRPPLAVVLPQHLSISQIIDLPQSPESEVEKLIADETIKLSGVTESRIVYDFVRTQAPAPDRQQFWVTLCQEGDIRERIQRLGIQSEDICEVTTTANALATAHRVQDRKTSRAILVHMGAHSTVVTILLGGQAVYASSFQMGGDFLTRAAARALQIQEEAAESVKRSTDLFSGPTKSPDFITAMEGWVSELRGQLNDWFQQNRHLAPNPAAFRLVASGGGFDQPGLLEYLKAQGIALSLWPTDAEAEEASPFKGFEVAFGTALQALDYASQPVSLLPADYQLAWRKRLTRQRIELASLMLILVCILLLALGTWHTLSLIDAREALRHKIQAGQDAVDEHDFLTTELITEYEHLRPVFVAQKSTIDTLRAFTLLQQSRSNRNFWYVLLADQQSYFSHPPAGLVTNRPVRTNVPGASPLQPPRASSTPSPAVRSASATSTNVGVAKPGLIAEVSVPGDAESSRQLLSQVVSELKQHPLFLKVDLLSEDLRRSLADPKVVVPDRHFVLSLDFADTNLFQPVQQPKVREKKPPPSTRRTLARVVGPEIEAAGKGGAP